MKTKNLIKLLQEADPSGEEHACVNNADIQDVMVEPAYYDGSLNIIEFDEDRHPVRGWRVRAGSKINISPIYIHDSVEYEGFIVEYRTEEDRKRYEHIDIESRRQHQQVEIDVDRNDFTDWVFRKIQTVKPVSLGWVGRIKEAANTFYDANKFGPDAPFTKVRMGKSYHNCREEYWEETFHVNWDDYSRIVIEPRESFRERAS